VTLPDVKATKLRQRDGDQQLPEFDCPRCNTRHRAVDPCGRQARPTANTEGRFVHHQVAEDLLARLEVGKQRYGTGLQAFNGRRSHRDAYEEVLDLAAYLKQADIEFEAVVSVLRDLVLLKDGPRDDAYKRNKEAAWQQARAILRDLGKLQ
jgi:hypothetical protein